jgi:hypothetical protein
LEEVAKEYEISLAVANLGFGEDGTGSATPARQGLSEHDN